MSVWSKKEAEARALEMDSHYMKTGFEGYVYERDKWYEIAKRADNTETVQNMQSKKPVR